MEAVLQGLLFLAWLATLFTIIKSNKTKVKKILWFVVVFFTLGLGVILYHFFGRDKETTLTMPKTIKKVDYTSDTPSEVEDILDEEPIDFYVTCVNCQTQHKNPTTNNLCSNCGHNMYKKYEDTYKKCSSCGGEYDKEDSTCPYCGAKS